MSKVPSTQQAPSQERAAARFDPAHLAQPMGRGTENSPAAAVQRQLEASQAEAVHACAGASPAFADQQLQQQASELAVHLSGRRRDLSRREEAFNARVAQWEDERRASRLFLREQHSELQQRHEKLQRWQQQLAAQTAELDAAGQTAKLQAVRRRELEERESQLQDDQQQLARDRQAIQWQLEQLEQERLSWRKERKQQEHELTQQQSAFQAGLQAVQDLSTRLRTQLELCEQDVQTLKQQQSQQQEQQARWKALQTMLRRRSSELDQERIALSRERDQLRQQTRAQRQALAAHWKKRRVRLETQLADFAQQRSELQDREQTVKLAAERVQRQQREAVEARLVAEHFRRHLEGKVAPAQWQTAADQLHQWIESRLAQTAQETADQQQALVTLGQRLADQQQKLEGRREELMQAMADRQQQIEQRDQLLDERENALNDRVEKLDEARRIWNAFWQQQQEQSASRHAPGADRGCRNGLRSG